MVEGDNVLVFARFRPFSTSELRGVAGNTDRNGNIDNGSNNGQSVIASLEKGAVKLRSHDITYPFDDVFASQTPQQHVFDCTARPFTNAIMQGFNATIFAYGQTGSGKTYTMIGNLHDTTQQGIIPRLVEDIFDGIQQADINIEFTVKVSYVEIYMEKIRDLLNVDKDNLKIRETNDGSTYIEDVTEEYVTGYSDMMSIMDEGQTNRSIASTKMNISSSRSHSVFITTVLQTDKRTGSRKTSKLVLVDLAGSETVKKSGAEGQTLTEAKYINKSLSALGNVMVALTDGSKHVPYRDSKLTRLLSDSLGGNSKTCLIITLSPAMVNIDETVSTLRFGTRAKKIKNTPKVNQELSVQEYKVLLQQTQHKIEAQETLIKNMEKDISELRTTINTLRTRSTSLAGSPLPAHIASQAASASMVDHGSTPSSPTTPTRDGSQHVLLPASTSPIVSSSQPFSDALSDSSSPTPATNHPGIVHSSTTPTTDHTTEVTMDTSLESVELPVSTSILQLQDKLFSLENEQTVLSKELENAKEQLREKKEELELQISSLHQFQSQVHEYKDKINHFEQDHDKMIQQIASLELDNKKLTNAEEEYQLKINHLEQTNFQLTQQLSATISNNNNNSTNNALSTPAQLSHSHSYPPLSASGSGDDLLNSGGSTDSITSPNALSPAIKLTNPVFTSPSIIRSSPAGVTTPSSTAPAPSTDTLPLPVGASPATSFNTSPGSGERLTEREKQLRLINASLLDDLKNKCEQVLMISEAYEELKNVTQNTNSIGGKQSGTNKAITKENNMLKKQVFNMQMQIDENNKLLHNKTEFIALLEKQFQEANSKSNIATINYNRELNKVKQELANTNKLVESLRQRLYSTTPNSRLAGNSSKENRASNGNTIMGGGQSPSFGSPRGNLVRTISGGGKANGSGIGSSLITSPPPANAIRTVRRVSNANINNPIAPPAQPPTTTTPNTVSSSSSLNPNTMGQGQRKSSAVAAARTVNTSASNPQLHVPRTTVGTDPTIAAISSGLSAFASAIKNKIGHHSPNSRPTEIADPHSSPASLRASPTSAPATSSSPELTQSLDDFFISGPPSVDDETADMITHDDEQSKKQRARYSDGFTATPQKPSAVSASRTPTRVPPAATAHTPNMAPSSSSHPAGANIPQSKKTGSTPPSIQQRQQQQSALRSHSSSASTSGVLGSSSSSSSTVSHSAPSKASENKLSVFGNKLKSALIKLGTVGGTISDSDSDAEREHKTGKQLPDSLP